MTALSLGAFFATCSIMWIDQVETTKLRNDDAAWKSLMAGKIGSEEWMQKYFDLLRQSQQEQIREKTGTVLDRFFASQEEREKRRNEVEQLDAQLIPGYKGRFQPLYDFVVKKFDFWIKGVKDRGVDVELKVSEAPSAVVNVADQNTSPPTVRTATFGNGYELQLQFVSAVVEDGRVARNFHFQMPFLKDGANTGEVWAMTVEEEEYRVNNQKPAKFNYKPYQGKVENPIEDKQLMGAINDSLDEVMSYVVAETTRVNSRSANQSP
jgi:hypothetical protein